MCSCLPGYSPQPDAITGCERTENNAEDGAQTISCGSQQVDQVDTLDGIIVVTCDGGKKVRIISKHGMRFLSTFLRFCPPASRNPTGGQLTADLSLSRVEKAPIEMLEIGEYKELTLSGSLEDHSQAYSDKDPTKPGIVVVAGPKRSVLVLKVLSRSLTRVIWGEGRGRREELRWLRL